MALVDARIEIAVEVGSTTMTIGQLKKLGRGAILSLDGVPLGDVEVHVNGNRVAAADLEASEKQIHLKILNLNPPVEPRRP